MSMLEQIEAFDAGFEPNIPARTAPFDECAVSPADAGVDNGDVLPNLELKADPQLEVLLARAAKRMMEFGYFLVEEME